MNRKSLSSTVDIVVPCYNYGRYLPFCVGTALNQRDVEVRVLIVDDNSSDNTANVAAELAAQDRRVFFVRNENNLGLVGSLNRGVIDWAAAPFTLALSADDGLTPGALARAVAIMTEQPRVGMTYGMAVVIGDRSDEYAVTDQQCFDSAIIPGAHFIRDFCRFKNGVASPTALVRTALQKRLGGYESEFPRTCDVEMWMRIATQSDIGVINAPQAFYRWHGANMSLGQIDSPLRDLHEVIATCRHVQANWGPTMEGLDVWIDEMSLRFALEACWLAGVALERGDMKTAQAGIAFAESLHPDLWATRSWWSYQAKRLLGSALMRGLGRGKAKLFQPFIQGRQFGRWPGPTSEAG